MSQDGQKTDTHKGMEKDTKNQAPSIDPQEVEDHESQGTEDEEEQHSEEPQPQPQAQEGARKGRKKRPYKTSEGSHSLENDKARASADYSVEEPDSQDKALTRHQGGPPATQQRQGGQVQGNQQGGGGKKGSGMPSVRLDVNLDLEIELKAKLHGDLTLSLLQ